MVIEWLHIFPSPLNFGDLESQWEVLSVVVCMLTAKTSEDIYSTGCSASELTDKCNSWLVGQAKRSGWSKKVL